MIRVSIVVFLMLALCMPALGGDMRESLHPGKVDSVRVNLNPAGAGIGFELEIDGTDPGLEPLMAMIRNAAPGCGHKCPNSGAIRFTMRDGSLIGIGLLPGHAPGEYGLRLYDGNRFLKTYCVDRKELLCALEMLGVPGNDPAFVP